ncbi:MAG: rlmN, partial [Devosia sp.]|nr:rlmN [Devosia sp.]
MSIALNLDHSSAIRPAVASRPSLIGLGKADLAEALVGAGIAERESKMRASQLWNWLYVNGVTDFERMTNVAKPVRQLLADKFILDRPEIVSEQVSSDGTRKWLFRFR